MAARGTVRRVATRPVRGVRRVVQRVFAPQIGVLAADRDRLAADLARVSADLDRVAADRDRLFHELGLAFESVTAAHRGIADLQVEQRSLRERLDMTLLLAEANQRRIEEYEQGLLEARRLNLRLAELTDVVTEVVLPLHDRDIDGDKVATLRADTR